MLDRYDCDLPGLGILLTPGLPTPLCLVALGGSLPYGDSKKPHTSSPTTTRAPTEAALSGCPPRLSVLRGPDLLGGKTKLQPLRPTGPCHPPLSHFLRSNLPPLPCLLIHSSLGYTPELWHSATWSNPFTCPPTPALQVPGEHEDEAQGPLREEERDTQA